MDWNILDIYIRVLFGRYPPSRFANFFPFSFPFPFQNSLLQQNRHPSHPILVSTYTILFSTFILLHSFTPTHYLTTSLPHCLPLPSPLHYNTTTLQHYSTVHCRWNQTKYTIQYNTSQPVLDSLLLLPLLLLLPVPLWTQQQQTRRLRNSVEKLVLDVTNPEVTPKHRRIKS